MNTISDCDGMFICVCYMYSLPVSHEANVLSWAAALRSHSGSTDRNARKVSIEYLVGRALLAGVFALLVGDIMAGARAVLAGAKMAGTDS